MDPVTGRRLGHPQPTSPDLRMFRRRSVSLRLALPRILDRHCGQLCRASLIGIAVSFAARP